MKKIIASTLVSAAALFCGASAYGHDGNFPVDSILNPSVDYLHVSAAVGFESEYVFRGEKRAGNSIQPQIEFTYPIVGFDLTAGAWNNSPLYGSKYGDLNELDLYADVSYSMQAFTVKAGYIYYWYTSTLPALEYSGDMEVYGGLSMDTASYLGGVNINPSVFYFYNWVLKQQTIEISLSYDIEIGEMLLGMPNLKLPIGLYGGYISAGNKDKAGEGITYFYYGAQADIAYSITEYCTISGGIRYSQRGGGEGTQTEHYELNGRENNLWFGGKVAFGF